MRIESENLQCIPGLSGWPQQERKVPPEASFVVAHNQAAHKGHREECRALVREYCGLRIERQRKGQAKTCQKLSNFWRRAWTRGRSLLALSHDGRHTLPHDTRYTLHAPRLIPRTPCCVELAALALFPFLCIASSPSSCHRRRCCRRQPRHSTTTVPTSHHNTERDLLRSGRAVVGCRCKQGAAGTRGAPAAPARERARSRIGTRLTQRTTGGRGEV